MAYNGSQNKQVVRLLHLKSQYPFESKDSAKFSCPFHVDKTPSLSINFSKGLYHCFSCNDGGNLDQLSMKMVGKTRKDLLGLANSFTIFHPQPQQALKEITEDDIHVDSRGMILPWRDSPAESYLQNRYIVSDVADSMNMGYVDEASFNGTTYTKRLVIPIYNDKGSLINMEGRDVTGESKVKCLYPHSTMKTVYEWYKLTKEEPVYVLEGLTKMACLRGDSFFANSTSIFGAAVTNHQIDLLNMFKHVILIPDNDESGKKVIDSLRTRLSTKFSVLKIGSALIKDIDEIPKKTGLTVKEYRERGNFIAQSFSSFVFG